MNTTHVALVQVHADPSRRQPRYQELLDELNAAALDAVESIPGWSAELIAADGATESELREAAHAADLVVILGGEDVDPVFFGAGDERAQPEAYETLADARQMAVVRDAAEAGRPVLGVCRGHQLINVVFGGTLHQEIGEHRRADHDPYVRTSISTTADLIQDASAGVYCTHHQAVDQLGDGLEVIARAEDGTIEAIAHRELPIVGVQWHPEHPEVARRELAALMQSTLARAEVVPAAV